MAFAHYISMNEKDARRTSIRDCRLGKMQCEKEEERDSGGVREKRIEKE